MNKTKLLKLEIVFFFQEPSLATWSQVLNIFYPNKGMIPFLIN